MAQPPGALPSIHEPFVTEKGIITRTWYRVLNGLTGVSGSLAEPVVVPPNSFFVSGTIDSGSTLTPATIESGTVLGNSSGALEQAEPQTVGPGLQLNSGVLALASQAADTLLGNPGSVAAVPQAIGIGAGLTLVFTGLEWVLNVVPESGTGTDLSGAQTLSWWRSS
jgi:hypothetical protein